jgi:hypothetical protein
MLPVVWRCHVAHRPSGPGVDLIVDQMLEALVEGRPDEDLGRQLTTRHPALQRLTPTTTTTTSTAGQTITTHTHTHFQPPLPLEHAAIMPRFMGSPPISSVPYRGIVASAHVTYVSYPPHTP